MSSAGYLTAIPSAIVGPVGARLRERRARRGLHADQRQLGPKSPQPDRDARREPTTADRDHDRPRAGRQLLGELEPERPLAGHDARVVEGVHEGRAALHDVRARGSDSVVEALAAEHDRRAVPPRRVDLGHRGSLGNEDGGGDACLARRPGNSLAVVAGARGDDPRSRSAPVSWTIVL